MIFGEGKETILILASIHGDETTTTPIANLLGYYLSENQEILEGKRVVLIPKANPDGILMDTRYNGRGVDLNRNFSTANWSKTERHGHEKLSEIETQLIMDVIDQYKPTRSVSIHQPLGCIDYDGMMARDLANYMNEECNNCLPVRKLGSKPGSREAMVKIMIYLSLR